MSKVDYETRAEGYAQHRQVNRAVLGALLSGVGPDTRVLEVGCGTGNYISAIQEIAGCPCIGSDPSGAMRGTLIERGTQVPAVAGSAGGARGGVGAER